MPTFDVIIPAYNAAKLLPQAIDSVVAQTFEDWRILLVDDGSTDNTAEVVAPYIEQLGPKLKYIKQANAGLPAARNTAIRNSSSELLALLDADDIWLPERLAESVKCFKGRPQVGLAYGFNSRIDADGVVIDTFTRRSKYAEGRLRATSTCGLCNCLAPPSRFVEQRSMRWECSMRRCARRRTGIFGCGLR